jgi:hypothetical protein
VIPIPDRLAMKLVIGIGCILLLALLVHDRNRWKAKTSHYAALLAAERGAHAATAANYRAAAELARQADKENAARVKSEQAAINQRSAHDLESRLAVARTDAERLRRRFNTAAADPGGGGATPMPGLSDTARNTAQAADEDRLPDSDRLTATEQAIQLDELIKWVRHQGQVQVNRD